MRAINYIEGIIRILNVGYIHPDHSFRGKKIRRKVPIAQFSFEAHFKRRFWSNMKHLRPGIEQIGPSGEIKPYKSVSFKRIAMNAFRIFSFGHSEVSKLAGPPST
jgi:hypothetical protein